MSNDPYQHRFFWTKFTKMLNEDQEYIEPLFCEKFKNYPKHTRDNNLKSIDNIEPYNPTPYDKNI